MSSYDDYQRDAAKLGKSGGQLNQGDIEFLSFQSKDPAKTYCEYMAFNETEKQSGGSGSEGCYIATCVYGSYDCPQVWTLRRFRDRVLRQSAAGRSFIRLYYALSPRLVRRFGRSRLFRGLCRTALNPLVTRLQRKGLESTPYRD